MSCYDYYVICKSLNSMQGNTEGIGALINPLMPYLYDAWFWYKQNKKEIESRILVGIVYSALFIIAFPVFLFINIRKKIAGKSDVSITPPKR